MWLLHIKDDGPKLVQFFQAKIPPICYAYLDDVETGVQENSFASCHWITRGWTLQELIAPVEVAFFDSKWSFLGLRRDLKKQLSQATGIDIHALDNQGGSYGRDGIWNRIFAWRVNYDGRPGLKYSRATGLLAQYAREFRDCGRIISSSAAKVIGPDIFKPVEQNFEIRGPILDLNLPMSFIPIGPHPQPSWDDDNGNFHFDNYESRAFHDFRDLKSQSYSLRLEIRLAKLRRPVEEWDDDYLTMAVRFAKNPVNDQDYLRVFELGQKWFLDVNISKNAAANTHLCILNVVRDEERRFSTMDNYEA
ncbi:Vegetative incompatibility protein HET-E-1 [Madurella mycetomatis]|uniref:Vegetative incompatibility protein HET-E-1 n=1 Tax=Madurella mycetomatis TaxID=100816 RepID=A0A175VSF9_9PEZI|nr:Vegetative incompatibility protein HET-E-1 [Madurella mycetomatis]KXX83068.1 Vegetative incompatibility protein HET-E-1 [Madurella mycetomatis]